MSNKWINAGHMLAITVASAIGNSALVSLGSAGNIRGIADRDSAANEPNELHRMGNWSLPKIAGALAVGAEYRVDISNTENGVHTLAALSATVVVFGYVSRAATSSDTEVDVVLVP